VVRDDAWRRRPWAVCAGGRILAYPGRRKHARMGKSQ